MNVVVSTVTKKWFTKRVILIAGIVLLVCLVGAATYIITSVNRKNQVSTTKTTQATLLDDYNTKQAALKKDPTNESVQLKSADAKSALLNYYLANKQYDNAGALTAGESSLQQLQSTAIIAEQKGDKQAAIAALNAQIDYYKKLPTNDTNYDMEIGNVQTEIKTLEQK